MRSQEFYQAMTEAFQDIAISPPKHTAFVVAQTSMDEIVEEREGIPTYSVISVWHMGTINWMTLPVVFYSTAEGSYSELQ